MLLLMKKNKEINKNIVNKRIETSMMIKFTLSFLSVGINSRRDQVFCTTGGVRNRRRGEVTM